MEQLRGAFERAGGGTVRWSPWSASRAWGSPASSTSSSIRTDSSLEGDAAASGDWLVVECRLRLLRQGDPVSAGDRPAQSVLPDRRARRHPEDPREGDRQAPHARRDACGRCCRRSSRCSTSPSRIATGRPSTRPSAAGTRTRRSSACCSARASASRSAWSSRISTGSTPRPRRVLDGLVESLPAARAPAPRELPPGVPPPLGQQDVLQPGCASIPCPRRAPPSCSARCSAPTRASSPLTPLLIERTEGNPFFLEESVRALVETERARRRSRRYRLARPLGSIQVPATVQADPRRPHRPAAARGQAPAAVGVGRRQGRALRAAARDRGAARGGVARQRSRTCRPPSSSTRRASSRISSTPSSTRSRMRWPTAACSTSGGARFTPGSSQAIETLHPDRLGEHVERLAQHALRGEVWPKAVAYLRQAAAKAVARSANREAVSCLEQALGVLRASAREPRDARAGHRPPARASGPAQRPRRDRAAARLPPRGRAPGRSARGSASDGSGGRTHGIRLHVDGPPGRGRRVWRTGAGHRPDGRRSRTRGPGQLPAGPGVPHAGRIPPCDRGVQAERRRARWRPPDRALRDARPAGGHVPSVMGWCLADLGEFPAAMAVAEEAVRMAEAADDRIGLALSQSRVGLIYLRQGDPERALPWLERSLDGSRRFNFEITGLATAGPLGEARAACGATGEALRVPGASGGAGRLHQVRRRPAGDPERAR